MVNLGVLRGVLQLDDKFTAKLNNSLGAVDGWTRKVEAFGSKMSAAGAGMLPLSLGISAVGAGALKMSTDLNSSMANVSALLTNISGPELDRVVGSMKTKIQSLAVDMGKSTNDISGGLYEVISALGYTDDTFGQLESAAKAGAAGLATTQDSLNFLTGVTKTYGDTSAAAFRKAADLGFQAVNYGQTTFPQLAASIGSVAPIAKVAGVSLEEMFAVIATATGVTGSTADVTTQMASAMNGLLAPSRATKEMFDDLRVSSGEAMIAQYGFVGALQEVQKYSERTGVAVLDILGRKEGFVLTASLAGAQAKNFALNLDRMGQAAKANGQIVDDAFKKQTQGINEAGFTWNQFMAKVQVAAQGFGDRLAAIFLSASKVFEPLINAGLEAIGMFGKLPAPIQAAAVALGVLAAVTPGVLFFLGGAATGWAALTAAVASGTAAYIANTTATTVNTVAVEANAVAATTAATTLKFAEGEQLAFHFAAERARDSTGKFTSTLWQMEQQLLPLSGAMTQTTVATSTQVAQTGLLARAMGMLLNPITLIVTAVTGLSIAWANYKNDWTRAFDVLIPPVGILRMQLDRLKQAAEENKQVVTDLSNIVKSAWVIALDMANARVQKMKDYLNSWSGTVDQVKSKLSGLSDGISGKFMGALNIMFPGLDKVLTMYDRIGKSLDGWKEKLHNFAEFMKDKAGIGEIPNSMNPLNGMPGFAAPVGAAVNGQYTGSVKGTSSLTAEYKKMREELNALTTAQKDQINAGLKLGMSAEEISKALKAMGMEFEVAESTINAYSKNMTEATKQTDEAAEAMKALYETLSGKEAFENAKNTMTVLQQIGGATKLTKDEMKTMLVPLQAAVDKYTALKQQAPQALLQTVIWLDAMNTKLEDSSNLVEILGQKIDTEIGDKPALFGKQLNMSSWLEPFKGSPEKQKTFLDDIKVVIAEIPGLLQQAFVGGGGFLGGLKAVAVEFAQFFAGKLQDGMKKAFGVKGQSIGSGGMNANMLMGSIGTGALSGIGLATSGAGFGQQLGGVGMAGIGMGASALMAGGGLASAAALAGITAGIGVAVIGAFAMVKNQLKPEWKKLGADIGRDFGVQLSEAALKAMEKDSKRIGRQAAGILNLGQIIEADGGLNTRNLDKYLPRLRDVFVMFETGKFTAQEAGKVFDDVWADFAKAGTDASGRLNQNLVNMITMARQMKIESAEISKYLQGQSASGMQGFTAVVNASSTQFQQWQKWKDAIKEAQEEIASIQKEDPTGRDSASNKRIEELRKVIEEAKKGLGDAANPANAQVLADLGVQAMAQMAAASAAGMPFYQALQAASPALTMLSDAYKNLGINVEDAGLKALLMQNQIMVNNPNLVAGIDGLSQSFIALSNMGMLNQSTFESMQRTGVDMYKRLVAEAEKMGLSGEEATRTALVPMQKYLREAEKQAKLLGIPLDENTQKLIDQSKELGIWKEEGKTGFELVTDAIIEMKDVLQDFVDTLLGIPSTRRVNVETNYTQTGQPPPDPTNAARGGDATRPDYTPTTPDGGDRARDGERNAVSSIAANVEHMVNTLPNTIARAVRDADRGAAVAY